MGWFFDNHSILYVLHLFFIKLKTALVMAILIGRLVGGDDPRLPNFNSLGSFRSAESTYRNTIMTILREIRTTHAGRSVIAFLENVNHDVIIVPDQLSRPVTYVREPSGASSYRSEGRGSGSEAVIFFTPNSLPHPYPQLNPQPNEVLLHELCHALRGVTGTMHLVNRPNGNIRAIPVVSFDNVEELFVITVTNVHRSELGRPLRGNHGGWRLRNPEVMRVAPYSTRLRQSCRRMPNFTNRLALIPLSVAPFNPFRDIYSDTLNSMGVF